MSLFLLSFCWRHPPFHHSVHLFMLHTYQHTWWCLDLSVGCPEGTPEGRSENGKKLEEKRNVYIFNKYILHIIQNHLHSWLIFVHYSDTRVENGNIRVGREREGEWKRDRASESIPASACSHINSSVYGFHSKSCKSSLLHIILWYIYLISCTLHNF